MRAAEVMGLTPGRFEHFLRRATRRELERVLRELWREHQKTLEFSREEAHHRFIERRRATKRKEERS